METKDKIKKILYEQDISLCKFAKQTGVCYSTCLRYTKEGRNISHKMAKRINAVYPQYSVSWLTGEKGDNPTSIRVYQMLDELGLTQSALAENVGISQPMFSSYLRGKMAISHKMAKRIHAVYPQYNISWLMGEN